MPSLRSPLRLMAKASQARRDHRDRNRPSGFGFAFADRIRYVHAADWDHVTASSSVLLSRKYLEVLDRHPPANLRTRYALVYRGDAPVAALCVQVVKVSGDTLVPPPGAGTAPEPQTSRNPARVLTKARASQLRRIRAQVLVCGNLLSWGQHGIAVAPGQTLAEIWPAIAEALYRIRRSEKLEGQPSLVMVKDLDDQSEAGIESFRRFRYRPFETEPNMVLEFPEGCRRFDDYLGLLNSRYRKTVRKTADAVLGAGFRIERTPLLTAPAGRVFDLYKQVQEQASVRPVSLAPDYLPAMAEALGEGFRWSLIRRENNGELAGFVTTLRDGDTAVGYYIGFDRELNETAPLYFRLLYAVVEDALDLGCRRVSFGRTALEPKAKLGAKPVAVRCWLRHRMPLASFILHRLLSTVPHDEAPERNPFRG